MMKVEQQRKAHTVSLFLGIADSLSVCIYIV
jgi:hypothetical protein